eukprot:TRINITY_DN7834_c0_g1_i2.p1 TRINITY_DN7834_c0_g1~~TRINITY_DN7834_c0_g1_i2.p1  ORF type:complete len:361 (-),score=99.82 TRINITY_DN7834_c0_g1_i2:59-1141(-)
MKRHGQRKQLISRRSTMRDPPRAASAEAAAASPVVVTLSRSFADTVTPATLCLGVRREWRVLHRIEPEAVYDAVLGTVVCCHPQGVTLASPALHCAKCRAAKAAGKVAQLSVVDRVQRYDAETGYEAYLFELKALCTSSRNHLGCKGVVLLLRLGPAFVLSKPVKLLFRRRGDDVVENARSRKYCALDLATTTQQQRQLIMPPVQKMKHKQLEHAAATPLLAGVGPTLYISVTLLQFSAAFSLHDGRTVLQSLPQLHLPGVVCRRDSALVSMTSPAVLRALLAAAPVKDYSMVGFTPSPAADPRVWYGVSVVACRTPEDSRQYLRAIPRFWRNAEGWQNPFRRDLVAEGLFATLATFTNY